MTTPQGSSPAEPSGSAATARVANFLFGGKDNFEPDRVLAERLAELFPDLPKLSPAAAAFPGRALPGLAARGVRQAIRLDVGIPLEPGLHHCAPDVRVAYVTDEKILVAYAVALLDDGDRSAVVRTSPFDPAAILADQRLGRLLDPAEPIAIVLAGHFVDRLPEQLRRWAALLPSGSALIMTHACADGMPADKRAAAEAILQHADPPFQPASAAIHLRTTAEVASLITTAGWTLDLMSGTLPLSQTTPTSWPTLPSLLTPTKTHTVPLIAGILAHLP
ncbi:SAM-dependent methyltransferase [Actinocorallia sp. API 0066]|uniref:SAM-dependent methyltransferase n=1 Tax=Actinocorallia sp. API 0066 TaxID=2896846 RepID=UPI001E456E68|nr:SAM-dependent methyltransferase [Actinocorallia sp. API 0066]MCD0449682.1 SAM-dependent methyltransferase [Actinocorallia sp. API 0066]